MKKNFYSSILTLSLLSIVSLPTWAQDTKPVPPSAEDIIQSLDCAGTVGEAGNTRFAKLSVAPGSSPRNGYKLDIATLYPNFETQLDVSHLMTSNKHYLIFGEAPRAYSLTIEKFGVHGAHRAELRYLFSMSPIYLFECYFY